MSTIYILERVYSASELLIKAYRIEAEAEGKAAELRKQYPDKSFRIRAVELVED